jgi:hypothetical protein
MPNEAEGGVLLEGESRLATRLRKDIGVEGKREVNVLPDSPQEAYAKVYVLGK